MPSKDPAVWFAIPSANPDFCRATLPAWRERGYRVAVLQNHARADIPADLCVWSDHYPGWAASINLLCRDIVPHDAPIVVSGGDDMLPDPDRAAHEIAREFLARFPAGFGVMQPTGDQLLGAGTFCGSPWLGRGWIRAAYQGRGPLHPAYRHNWADNELHWVARCAGALWARPDLTQRHEHFSRTGAPKPDYWAREVEARDRHDVQLFLARAWQGFPGAQPLGRPPLDLAPFHAEYPHTAERYWSARYGAALVAEEPTARLAAALRQCAAAGLRRVAIFGAGSHTRAAAAALADSPVAIACFIDDNPALRADATPAAGGVTGSGTGGGTGWLWGWPILSVREAAALRPDAVILSSATQEDALARAAAPLHHAGATIIRLYTPPAPTPAPTPALEAA